MIEPSAAMDQKRKYRHLLIVDDLDGRRTVILDAATYSIGRDRTNPIVLNSKMVSRQHAILLRVTSPETSTHLFRIIDGDLQGKRSTNGLLINGRRLFSHDLKHGDTVVFGNDVKAKYYILANVTDSDVDEYQNDPDWSAFLSASQNPFETLIPSDEDFFPASEASMVRLASFPELTPNPIMEIDLSGMVTYLNPSAVLQFPNISELGNEHPMLADLLPTTVASKERATQSNFFVREVELGNKVYEQSVHYIAESDLIRSYVSDITERKRAEEQLRHQAQREAIINRIVQAMRRTMVTTEVLQITVGLLLEALDATHCMIVQTQSDGTLGNHFVSVTVESKQELVLANDLFLQYCQAQLQSGQQVILKYEDSSLDLEMIAVTQQCEIQLILMTPLFYLGQYLGCISLLQCFPESEDMSFLRQWTADDLGLVKTIADQCAIAIHQAQLYKQVQDLNADLERQVRDRTAQLEQKMLELEQLNSLKDDFLSTVSHELRTPMSNIKMSIHMLNQFPLEPRQKRYISILEQECQRETELINDLLDLQRLEAGANPAEIEPIDMSLWLPKVIEPFKSRTRERGQEFKIYCAEELKDFKSDRIGLERIVAELLNNACKYTPEGKEIKLSVRCIDRATATIRFEVSNAAEIPEAEVPRVFDKFYRVPNADPWKQGGTGLGLALIKRLVEQLSGSISVESGNGITTFIVDLPYQPVMERL